MIQTWDAFTTFATLVFWSEGIRWIFGWNFWDPCHPGIWTIILSGKVFGARTGCLTLGVGCFFGAYSNSLFDTEIAFRKFGYQQDNMFLFKWKIHFGSPRIWGQYMHGQCIYYARANWANGITWILKFDFTKLVPLRHSFKNKKYERRQQQSVFFWKFDCGLQFRCPFSETQKHHIMGISSSSPSYRLVTCLSGLLWMSVAVMWVHATTPWRPAGALTWNCSRLGEGVCHEIGNLRQITMKIRYLSWRECFYWLKSKVYTHTHTPKSQHLENMNWWMKLMLSNGYQKGFVFLGNVYAWHFPFKLIKQNTNLFVLLWITVCYLVLLGSSSYIIHGTAVLS